MVEPTASLWWAFLCLQIDLITSANMKAKGAAVTLNLNTMSSSDLLNAQRTVINDPLQVHFFFTKYYF